MAVPRVWLITGASSGLGRAVTEVIINKGDIAVATLRSPSTLADVASTFNANRLLILKCDVTIPDDISAAFKKTIEVFGRCDIVFNNAGFGILGEIESTVPDDQARAMFEVNFWGAANVSREAVRVFRDINPPNSGGRLLNVSSGSGFSGNAGIGYYSASKHALEGFTESLSKEMDPAWNIKISILEPGAFKTRAHTENLVQFPSAPAYSDPKLPSQKVRQWFSSPSGITGDPVLAAERIFEFAGEISPPLRLPLGKGAISSVRNKLKSVSDEVDVYESWSENLVLQS